MINKYLKNNRGYTLLFAVLVSSIVLSVGISILTISKKEFLLASSARESLSAFYAADSGLECVMYWDNTPGGEMATSSNASVTCGNTTATVSYNNSNPTSVANFDFNFGSNNNACVIVTVEKKYEDVPGLGYLLKTKIESRGYNLGWDGASCSQASPKRVERALRLNY